jgi:AraC-like DNA-binding protein
MGEGDPALSASPQSLFAGLSGLPRVFSCAAVRDDSDPQVLATRLAQHFPFTDFHAWQGRERPFWHRSSTVMVGGLPVSGGYTSSCQGRVDDHPGVGAVNLIRAGSAFYEFNGARMSLDAASPLLFSAGESYTFAVDHYAGVAYSVNMARLRSTAQAMAGPAGFVRVGLDDLEAPRVLATSSERRRVLIQTLWGVFDLLDQGLVRDPLLLRHLQIEDVLYRSMALLLLPRLDQALEHDQASAVPARQRILQELMEWIDAHLATPITLTQLEQRSGYGRRSLQIAFQERYGCGPMQWIRLRRLELARQSLLSPRPADTVSAIAQRSGYTNLASFSRDFFKAFGVRPSELLRASRSDLRLV